MIAAVELGSPAAAEALKELQGYQTQVGIKQVVTLLLRRCFDDIRNTAPGLCCTSILVADACSLSQIKQSILELLSPATVYQPANNMLSYSYLSISPHSPIP
eukprot:GHUV01014541.1.p1 GENE.GHUV01014541.1~~GHUV01014541.1.p1  ORF type:complete len:102 (+),score=23.31 GHUV01014541.1:3-308(+)